MSKYADTVFQSTTELEKVTKDSPLRQDESNFNIMLNFNLISPDGSFGLLGDSNGYLELNFYQQTFSSNLDEVNTDTQKVGLHYCNKDDRSHFYD